MLSSSQLGAEDQLLKAVKKLENVEEAYVVYAAYHIVMKSFISNYVLVHIMTSRSG